MATKALRTIGVAYKIIQDDDDLETKDQFGIREIEKENFILICILGIKDNLRAGVRKSIQILKEKSCITVRMITGDNEATATAIARDAGIIEEGEENAVM